MNIEDRILRLDSQIDNENINEILSQIVLNIDNIDKVEIIDLESGVQSSALFSLLHSIKKRKEDIEIPFLNTYKSIENMGKVLFVK